MCCNNDGILIIPVKYPTPEIAYVIASCIKSGSTRLIRLNICTSTNNRADASSISESKIIVLF